MITPLPLKPLAVPAADRLAVLVLLGVTLALYLGLPRQGDIWWMDASRNALNGAFVLDFLREMPLRHPVTFAYDYYRQWPALTVLFYPPLFYGALAIAYALLGVSEAAALVVELAFLFALGWGAYRLSRLWLAPAPALAASLLLIGAPELLFWGRQIMLDVPAYAFLVWAALHHVRYLRHGRTRNLVFAALLAIAAIYTKYNAAFFVIVLALSLLQAQGWKVLLQRRVLLTALLGLVLLLPILAVFFTFGAYNLQQAASVPDAVAPRWSIAGLIFYAAVMPTVVAWPTVVLALLAVPALIAIPRLRLPRDEALFLLIWLVFGYAFYAMIAVKEERHILFITYPIPLAAVLFIEGVVKPSWLRAPAAFAIAAMVLTVSALTRPAPFVTGMREAALAVARLAPPDSNVAFWGRLDGTFIYAMRAYTGRTDLGVIRLDKLLFSNVAVEFERGATQRMMDPVALVKTLTALHAQYVVVQTRYLDDMPPVAALRTALAGGGFTPVQTVPMSANYPYTYVSEFVIYRLDTPVPPGRVSPHLQVELLGRTL